MRVSPVLVALPAVHAIAFPGPNPTQLLKHKAGEGWNPKPTQAPNLAHAKDRRAISANTCGWADGQSDEAIYCNSARTCMLYTPAGIIGMAGCCETDDLQNCGWNTGCVDQETYSTSCTDNSCLLDDFLIKCTDSTAPYCVSWTYPIDQVQDHGCGTDPASTWETIEKSVSTNGGSTSVVLSYVPEDSVTGWRADEKSTIIPSSGRSTRSSTSDFGALATGGTSDSNFTYSRSRRALSIGAIVGIVIGGVSALAVIIGAIWYVFWDRRRKARNAAAATISPGPSAFANNNTNNFTQQDSKPYQGPPPPMQQYGQSPPPAAGYYGQDSKFNPQASPQPQYAQPYPPPAASPNPSSVSPYQQGAMPVPAPYYRGSVAPSEAISQDGLRPNTMFSTSGASPVSAVGHSPSPSGTAPHAPPQGQGQPGQNPNQIHELG